MKPALYVYNCSNLHDIVCCSLNRMHVMEGDGDKVGEMVAESAPELVTAANTTDIKLVKEVLSLPAVEKIQVSHQCSLR